MHHFFTWKRRKEWLSGGSCERRYETSFSVKHVEFVYHLSDLWLRKKKVVAWSCKPVIFGWVSNNWDNGGKTVRKWLVRKMKSKKAEGKIKTELKEEFVRT
jgi:hypothetical protein